MSKISYLEYQKLVIDPETSDEEILRLSTIRKGEGGFDFILLPNPEFVEVSDAQLDAESALGIGNNLERTRRVNKFWLGKLFTPHKPVLVSEGDSWFQFPFIIDEVIDWLREDYLIWSVGAAGDTAKNMVFSQKKKYKTEFMRALKAQRDDVRAFLFSAAGNDIIGEDPVTKIAALQEIVKQYNGDDSDVEGHIDMGELNDRMTFLQEAYEEVISQIRSEACFESLPIIIHGYDYAFPYPFGDEDPRDPSYAANNEWLGEPLDARLIPHSSLELRHGIIKYLIDRLYAMLETVAGNSQQTQVWVVDCRGCLPSVSDWNDEIHGTSVGFEKVALRFREVLAHALS